jgi:hypothetical protein
VTAAGRPCGSRLIRGYREDDGVLAEGRVLSVLSGTPDISVDAKDTARRHPQGPGAGGTDIVKAICLGPAPQLFQMFIRSHGDLLPAFVRSRRQCLHTIAAAWITFAQYGQRR